MAAAKYEVLLYGSTGFTGLLTARYLDTVPGLAGKRWAIAGRTESKLAALRSELRSAPDVVCCSLDDAGAVEAMVKSTRVVLTCAGPYSAYNGGALLGACAKAGVHYSDLAGEGFWQREMIEQFDSVARSTGAKIVLGGGVDSIPSDLGAYLALRALHPAAGQRVNVRGVYTEYTGSFSGGTLNSGRATSKAKREGRLTPELASDPYILAPELGAGFQGADSAAGTATGMPSGWKRSWFTNGYAMLMVRKNTAGIFEMHFHDQFTKTGSLGTNTWKEDSFSEWNTVCTGFLHGAYQRARRPALARAEGRCGGRGGHLVQRVLLGWDVGPRSLRVDEPRVWV
jgi:short subunit dehydrogenase-like uncharacterized protein